ncbi:MAG: hypothetical protein Q8R36_01285, partial [bacterium]|nr:hypothetical protein [bacterium]
IASGFPENTPHHKPLFNPYLSTTDTAKKINKKEEILNAVNGVTGRKVEAAGNGTVEENDEWGAVPAFLRRSKKDK